MRSFLVTNIGWKLLSLLIALLLWISVANQPELATFISVPVEYRAGPDELEISSDVVESVYLEVRGPSGKLQDFTDSRPAVVLDLSRVHLPGERTFTIDDGTVNLPRRIRLVRAIPSQLRFQFERRITRTVPVQVRFSGAPQAGYEIAEYAAAPSELAISGPESRVKGIDFAVTDPVDLSSVVGVSEFRVNTFLGDPHVRFPSSHQVAVKVSMKKK